MKFSQFGKYTMLKKLTTGGMAEIFLATDIGPTGVGRFVVIKRVLAQFSENEEFKDMFKNEGKVACNLKHRNIAPVYEFGIENSQFFLSMEYVAGRNLRELIKKLESLKKEISIEDAVYIIREAASGLNYAHNAIDSSTGRPLNLIHRDVSPQNIMLSFDGEIKLIDFGISKIADTDLTRAGHLKGKFGYMSPEQARGETLDLRTDIFCLGVILWEMLAGKRLFSFKNEMTALKKVRACDIPSIQKEAPRVPSELAEIVHRALHKNKNSRYKTAAKMERDLSVFLNRNYPEFSQYDFISSIKRVYSKNILEERERQKSYSKEFKKYVSSLDEHEGLNYMAPENVEQMLSLPSIDSVSSELSQSKRAESTKTKTEGHEEESAERGSLSGYREQTQVSQTGESATHLMPDDEKSGWTTGGQDTVSRAGGPAADSGVFKKNIREPEQNSAVTKSAEEFLLKSARLKKGKPNLRTAPRSLSSSRSYNYKMDTLYREDKKRRFVQIGSLIVTIAILAGAFLAFKRRDELIHSSLADKIFSGQILEKPSAGGKKPPASQTSGYKALRPPASVNPPGASYESRARRRAAPPRRRILVKTRPSGAMIYANGKFLSYTPAALSVIPNKNVRVTLEKQGYVSRPLTSEELRQSDLYITLQKTSRRRKIRVVR